MSTRRDFIAHTAAAGMVAAASAKVGRTVEENAAVPAVAKKSPMMLGRTPRITGVTRREETVRRLGGMGDNFHMSWAADDRQYVSVCDGMGWFDPPKAMYNSRLWAIEGSARDARFQDVPTYPGFVPSAGEAAYYSFGTLALDGRIYQFLSSPNQYWYKPDLSSSGARFVGAKLIYSPDNGRTWCNQDGSTPIVWTGWPQRSRENMLFFEESQDAFSLLSVLQMGRNYEANRDGFVYLYAPNGSTDGTMNELVLARAPKAKIVDRAAYEFFTGLRRDGGPTWTLDIDARNPIHRFPRGWVNKILHPWAWMPSVSYNMPLGLYMMTSWGNPPAANGDWFSKASYLGFWVAQSPWGPWTQIHEETAWRPAQDPDARAFAPQIAPKWIAEDGKSFWLVWSDFQGGPKMEQEVKARGEQLQRMGATENLAAMQEIFRRHMPYYAFNAQRVDLIIA